MAQCGKGVCVVPNTTECRSRVHLFNSFGRRDSLSLETRRVHPSYAGIARVEKSNAKVLCRLFAASSLWVNRQSPVSIRPCSERGSTPSGGLGKGVLSTESKESSLHSEQQLTRKPSASGASARSWRWAGAEGRVTGADREADGRGRGRESSQAVAASERRHTPRESCLSAGWREVAESCHAEEGMSHG